jgi:hypothetical protein
MRKSIRYLLLAALFVPFLSCGEAPGTFSMSFSWEEEPGGELWVWIRVEEREDPSQSGRILGSSGPDSYIFGEPFSVQIEGVANGDNRVIVVEAREGTNSSLPVLYYGVSEPFSLVAGKHAQVDVPMSLQTSEAQLFAAQVKLLFGGEQAHDIAFAQVTQATIWTRSAGATGVVLANDESFSANLTNLSLEDEQLECETSMEEDVEWTVCQLHNWDLTGGLDSVSDGALSVFVKFIDRYGYESQVNKASVNLDMSGPLAVIASLSPAVARPSGTVSLSVTFHEALSEEVGANVLEVVPELPAGSEISAPERVGDSLTWLWSITIGPDAAEAGLAYTFEVQTEDELGNQEEEKQQLQDKSKEPLTLNIDSSPPLLANSDEIALAQTLFGPADVGTTIEFDMVFEEDNPRTVVNQEGECSGICPTVRLGIAELGKVSVVEGELGLTFHYQYTVDNADWSGGDKEVAINISWSDEAGNGTDVELVDRLRFDFQAPTALSSDFIGEVTSRAGDRERRCGRGLRARRTSEV